MSADNPDFFKPLNRSACTLLGLMLAGSLTLAQAQSTATAQNEAKAGSNAAAQSEPDKPAPSSADIGDQFIALLGAAGIVQSRALIDDIRARWEPGLVPMALEILPYSRNPFVHSDLLALITETAGIDVIKARENNINDWYYWLWNQKIEPVAQYPAFKANLFKRIDPRFEQYFRDRKQADALIRFDEVRWGGVRQDGIPPLRGPKMIAASEADYLGDDNVIFGMEINGDARAYPKRILAWHEMFTDTIGGVSIAGVYCTLCGAVIPFRTEFDGTDHQLGTSGFLYRSNKLMYDKATQSLWSTSRGEPVIGPLAGKGIQLAYEAVVTTTWGEWKRRHPDTKVLSLETGHKRDYGEGAAYASYFGTDKLMFNTPFRDDRLANKQEILALRFPGAPNQQMAIDTDYLKKNPVYSGKIGVQRFVVLTDTSGANRVFDPGDVQFAKYDGADQATDKQGRQWQVGESSLKGPDGAQLKRLPYHRAFWFGWRAAFPETQLIK